MVDQILFVCHMCCFGSGEIQRESFGLRLIAYTDCISIAYYIYIYILFIYILAFFTQMEDVFLFELLVNKTVTGFFRKPGHCSFSALVFSVLLCFSSLYTL